MFIVFSEKNLFILIFIKKKQKQIEYHQEIFCQLLSFFNSLCSYLSQKCVAKIKVLPKISIELH